MQTIEEYEQEMQNLAVLILTEINPDKLAYYITEYIKCYAQIRLIREEIEK